MVRSCYTATGDGMDDEVEAPLDALDEGEDDDAEEPLQARSSSRGSIAASVASSAVT